MDRRKRREFAPSGETLEERKLLSTVSTAKHSNILTNPALSTFTGAYGKSPSLSYSTLVEKETRIKNLPLFLKSIEYRRYLDPTTVANLQTDLSAFLGNLHYADAYHLNNFNVLLRDISLKASLSTSDISSLNTDFGAVMASAGANTKEISNLQAHLTDLSRIDAQGSDPVYVATNDYAYILQLALGIGRPIDTPTAPHLLAADHLNGRSGAVTVNHQPRLTGTYDPGTTIRLLDANQHLLGTSVVDKKGNYTISPDIAFAPGRYTFFVQGTDAAHELSALSPPLTVSIVTETHGPHPKGPKR